ncbi:beta-galactosidase trimerization domain-containing protein [Streptomyces sp. NPDC050759]|uniref:beta-galactosidase trimerization domain-containing protein n=1 Tax=Streptomyces sp. NPDC050759 TaxID=3365635 RepID=UPI00378D99E7
MRRHPVLVVPALYVADDGTLDWLAAYAHAGGHLALGPRTEDRLRRPRGKARQEPAPRRLTTAAGAQYEEFSNLLRDITLRAVPGSPLELPEQATATRWVDGLTVLDAEVLAAYDHPHFGRWPAVTTRRHGAGRVTCVGTVPGRDLARALAAWPAPAPGSGRQNLPPSVTAATGTSPDGRRVHVVHNWSWDPMHVTAPLALSDVLGGTSAPVGTARRPGARGVRIFLTAGEETASA